MTLEAILPILSGLGSAACSLLVFVVFIVAAVVFIKKSGVSLGGGFGGAAMDTSGLQAMYTDTLGYTSVPSPDPARTHMVRQVDGVSVHLETHTQRTATAIQVSYVWHTETPGGLRVHVVDKSVADRVARAIRDGAMGRERAFQPTWPTAHRTGDLELDQRFTVYAPSPADARAAAQLREALLALPFVDVVADDTGVRLSDPFQQNLLERMGGPMGMAKVATAQGIAIQTTLHQQVAALVVGLAKASPPE
jgi:hypothetical protein